MTSNKKRIRLSEIIGPAFYETHKLIDMGVIDEAVEAGGRASLKSSYVGTELVLQLLKHPDCHALVTRQVGDTILSDAEVVSKTATEINSSAGDYSLSIMDFQHLYYDALQAALRLGDQIGQAYRLCDASAWSADELTVTWGNGVLYDADQEWTERKELVQMGLLKPELALAWKFDLPAETEADLAEIRKNYMPELKDLEG